uniref:Syndecan n=1 Tax=Leptobrachium leishanense TaxID=445787 RepID=A0A8C5M674_9ANUR
MERLFVALCLLGLCGSVTLANELKYPVDDDDGSADDEDYSGSGMEDFFTFTSDIANEHSGSMTTVRPIVVPVPTEPELSNVTRVAVEPTTEYTELIKQHEEVLEKLNPTQGSPVEQTTAHITTGKTTADGLDVNWHLHKDHEHHKTTSQSMVEEDATQGPLDKSHHVHIVPHAETTTSPPSDDEDLVNHGITTSSPVQDGESVNDHIHNEVLESTPVADRAKTTESYEGMVFGVEEKPTTKAPLVDDSHGSEGPVVTTGPPDVEIVEGGVHHITETTIPPLNADDNLVHNMVTTPTQNVESDHSRATTPSEADKHHKHHHGHHHHGHHHHHNHTTTAHPTDSDGQHKVSPSEPADRFAPDPTDVWGYDQTDDLDDGQSVEKFTETPVDHPAESSTPVPDDRQPFGTEFPAPDESDSDVSESKEEEESGDDTDGKDLFFETNETGVGGANEGNERSAVVESGSSDASHGIMERKELLAGIIAGGAVGLIFASFLVGFVLYRMKKKDEGSYSLEEPKQSNGGYQKPREQREFFA